MCLLPHLGTRLSRCVTGCCIPLLLPFVATPAAQAEILTVKVLDAQTGAPLAGAYVQIGPGPGDPFDGNWAISDQRGEALFDNPFIVGPQTVTAGADGFSLLTVIEAVEGSITLKLNPAAAVDKLPEPRSKVSGVVTGIDARNNDGYIDVGIVYPTISLSSLLSGRMLSFDVPPDTVNLPLLGSVVLPGNMIIPMQTEYLFMRYTKPMYHFYVADKDVCDIVAVFGRLPLSSAISGNISLDEMEMSSGGVRRGMHVDGDTDLTIHADIRLMRGIEVSMPDAPAGTDVFVTSVADLPGQGGMRSLFFDAKTASADTLGSLLLAGMNPSGELSDAVPYLAGYYAGGSPDDLFQVGRIDRTPMTLPASRALSGLYEVPDVLQFGDEFAWGDVAIPGVNPDPTWAVSTFRLRNDDQQSGWTLWEIWAPAERHGFRLPILDPSAPGGLLDPDITPQADCLLWDLWLADPSGGIGEAMETSFATLTRWSRKTVEASPPIASVEEFGLGTVRGDPLRFRLAPNPGRSNRDILWEAPLAMGAPVAWDLLDITGRRLMGGLFPSSGSTWDRLALRGTERLTAGVYWVRLRTAEATGTVPMIVIR